MNEQQDIQTFQRFFQSFAGGDMGAIDRYFSPDVEYVVVSKDAPGTAAAIPWIGTYRGREAVKDFLIRLVQSVEVLRFEPRDYIAQDGKVAVFGYFKYRARSTGKDMETDWAIHAQMKDGLIARYHFYENTFAIAEAFRHSGSWEVENDGSRRTVPAR